VLRKRSRAPRAVAPPRPVAPARRRDPPLGRGLAADRGCGCCHPHGLQHDASHFTRVVFAPIRVDFVGDRGVDGSVGGASLVRCGGTEDDNP